MSNRFSQRRLSASLAGLAMRRPALSRMMELRKDEGEKVVKASPALQRFIGLSLPGDDLFPSPSTSFTEEFFAASMLENDQGSRDGTESVKHESSPESSIGSVTFTGFSPTTSSSDDESLADDAPLPAASDETSSISSAEDLPPLDDDDTEADESFSLAMPVQNSEDSFVLGLADVDSPTPVPRSLRRLLDSPTEFR